MDNHLSSVMEFHISRKARDRYQFDELLFGLNGHILFTNFRGARVFAQKINQKRDVVNFPEQAVQAGQIYALGMIDEILHFIFQLFLEQINPDTRTQMLTWVISSVGEATVNQALRQFSDQFPPTGVYQGKTGLDEYLAGQTEGISNREILLEELLMLWLTNQNPAADLYTEFFSDISLEKNTAYLQVIQSIQDYFSHQPQFGPEAQPLVEMLRSPAVAVPYSLSGQLEFIREHWGMLLGKYIYRLLGSLDLISEEEKMRFFGPGPVPIPTYKGAGFEGDVERFSPDYEWMPTLVLIAKNTYVWLDQLAKQYQREIVHLDQIPDEELELLSRRGITGLWLIGLWERSQASARIKQLTGNPDAVASAYSLARYDISADLGGQSAFENLRQRAWRYGIRLASDMVPNHMGIDSSWVVEHPDWFISLDYSPFPAYTFNGEDLSVDGRAGIFIEDHYYNRTDAAVVFKRRDRNTGQEKYIYHGNDGTSMPWNDTAQLNYLNPEVREAVIQTILHVARQFPIIRFDAAMTLAKKHYQRLWYPEPGSGGDIPTRAEFGMTRAQLDQQFPEEFWREVVDRVAKEVPGTLLLAEAFWLMESYFVRSLGMHRVYNSAFMNLLRNEDNAKYRTLLKNTLEFDPEILKRYVNFMNNPDERTAVDQFGKGDKYFGICTLMVTFPGLPMIGHGQIEGLSEKYGMEFRRALWDEKPDQGLIQRHEREIVPLLHHRRVFSGVDDFLLYDFYSNTGSVNEDVYAFSNRSGMDRGLIVFHNRFASTQGWIRISAGFSAKTGSGGEKVQMQKNLGEGLNLTNSEEMYTIFKDITSGLEYLFSSKGLCEKGLYLELNAYQTRAFVDIREVQDDEIGRYRRLAEYLNGRGVPKIEEALQEVFLQPILNPFGQLVNGGMLKWYVQSVAAPEKIEIDPHLNDEVEAKLMALYQAVSSQNGDRHPEVIPDVLQVTLSQFETILTLPVLNTVYPISASRQFKTASRYLVNGLKKDSQVWITLFVWAFVHNLGRIADPDDRGEISRTWIDEYLLGRAIHSACQEAGLSDTDAWKVVSRVKLMTSFQDWYRVKPGSSPIQILEYWLSQPELAGILGINRYQEILWFNQEAFENLLWWMMSLALVQIAGDKNMNASSMVEQVISTYQIVARFLQAEAKSGYQLEKLIAELKKTTVDPEVSKPGK